jgi:hypothetical protein
VIRALVPPFLRRALLASAGRDVELAADDRLDPRLLRGEVEVDATEEVAVVGERDRRKAKLARAVDQLLELRGAVEEAVLRVNVEVDELGVVDGVTTPLEPLKRRLGRRPALPPTPLSH